MTKLKTLLIALLLPAFAFAQPQLESVMKKMGQDFKALGKQITDPSKNASSLALAQDLQTLIPQAKDVMPDTIASMTEPERSHAFQDFQDRIQVTLDAVGKLVVALQANDNKTATQLVSEIAQDKKDGHDKYKD